MPNQFVIPNLKSKEEHILLLCATPHTAEDALWKAQTHNWNVVSKQVEKSAQPLDKVTAQ